MSSGHNKEIYDLAWSPCGNYFITASIDNTARVWSLSESKLKKKEARKEKKLNTLVFFFYIKKHVFMYLRITHIMYRE